MASRKAQSTVSRDELPSTDHMDRLVAAFETLAGEVKIIRDLLDRFLDDFQWALSNDKLSPASLPRISELVGDFRDPHARCLDEKTDEDDAEKVEVPDHTPPTADKPHQQDLFS